MKTVLDSSAFAKRYILESGSITVDKICQNATDLALCILCVPEIMSALNRRLREGTISQTGYNKAKTQLAVDVGDAVVLQLEPAVISTAIYLLENNVLRAMDAIHVACAIEWGADLFVTADNRQHTAAQSANLNAQLV